MSEEEEEYLELLHFYEQISQEFVVVSRHG